MIKPGKVVLEKDRARRFGFVIRNKRRSGRVSVKFIGFMFLSIPEVSNFGTLSVAERRLEVIDPEHESCALIFASSHRWMDLNAVRT